MSARIFSAVLALALVASSALAQTASLGYHPGIRVWEGPSFTGESGETGGVYGCFGIKRTVNIRSYKVTANTTVKFYSELDCKGEILEKSSKDDADVYFSAKPLSVRLEDYDLVPIPTYTTKAVAVLSGNSTARGKVTFTQVVHNEPTTVLVNITGLAPGKHGLHIHVTGDLSNGCASLGLHWNPFNVTHGDIDAAVHHEGDLGNVVADEKGNVVTTLKTNHVTLVGHLSVIGRGIIIHADQDDLGLGTFADSKTVGHSGSRLACGIIDPAILMFMRSAQNSPAPQRRRDNTLVDPRVGGFETSAFVARNSSVKISGFNSKTSMPSESVLGQRKGSVATVDTATTLHPPSITNLMSPETVKGRGNVRANVMDPMESLGKVDSYLVGMQMHDVSIPYPQISHSRVQSREEELNRRETPIKSALSDRSVDTVLDVSPIYPAVHPGKGLSPPLSRGLSRRVQEIQTPPRKDSLGAVVATSSPPVKHVSQSKPVQSPSIIPPRFDSLTQGVGVRSRSSSGSGNYVYPTFQFPIGATGISLSSEPRGGHTNVGPSTRTPSLKTQHATLPALPTSTSLPYSDSFLEQSGEDPSPASDTTYLNTSSTSSDVASSSMSSYMGGKWASPGSILWIASPLHVAQEASIMEDDREKAISGEGQDPGPNPRQPEPPQPAPSLSRRVTSKLNRTLSGRKPELAVTVSSAPLAQVPPDLGSSWKLTPASAPGFLETWAGWDLLRFGSAGSPTLVEERASRSTSFLPKASLTYFPDRPLSLAGPVRLYRPPASLFAPVARWIEGWAVLDVGSVEHSTDESGNAPDITQTRTWSTTKRTELVVYGTEVLQSPMTSSDYKSAALTFTPILRLPITSTTRFGDSFRSDAENAFVVYDKGLSMRKRSFRRSSTVTGTSSLGVRRSGSSISRESKLTDKKESMSSIAGFASDFSRRVFNFSSGQTASSNGNSSTSPTPVDAEVSPPEIVEGLAEVSSPDILRFGETSLPAQEENSDSSWAGVVIAASEAFRISVLNRVLGAFGDSQIERERRVAAELQVATEEDKRIWMKYLQAAADIAVVKELGGSVDGRQSHRNSLSMTANRSATLLRRVKTLQKEVTNTSNEKILTSPDKAKETTFGAPSSGDMAVVEPEVLIGVGGNTANVPSTTISFKVTFTREQQIIRIQSVARGFKARRIAASLRRARQVAKLQPHRTRVVMELLGTETSYVAGLETAIKVFLKPMRAIFDSTTKKGGVGKAEVEAIFGNIEDIAEKHQIFLKELREATMSWDENTAIAEVFLKMCTQLYVYIPYCNGFETSHETVETAGGVRATKRNDLNSFLILPVQRIPRYELLLKDLVKHTWSDHPEYDRLVLAYDLVREAAKLLNRAKKYNESKSKIERLQQKSLNQVAGKTSASIGSGSHLAHTQERYIGEGELLFLVISKAKAVGRESGEEVERLFSFLPLAPTNGPNQEAVTIPSCLRQHCRMEDASAGYLFLFADNFLLTKRALEKPRGGFFRSNSTKLSVIHTVSLETAQLFVEEPKSLFGGINSGADFAEKDNVNQISQCRVRSRTSTRERESSVPGTTVPSAAYAFAVETRVDVYVFWVESKDLLEKWVADFREAIETAEDLIHSSDVTNVLLTTPEDSSVDLLSVGSTPALTSASGVDGIRWSREFLKKARQRRGPAPVVPTQNRISNGKESGKDDSERSAPHSTNDSMKNGLGQLSRAYSWTAVNGDRTGSERNEEN
ncbi:Superoxide dismutase [Cu-Zn], partial [Gonapodya sp. JEL0774]